MKKAILAFAAVVLTSTAMTPAAFAVGPKPKCPPMELTNMPCPPDEGTDLFAETTLQDPFGSPEQVDPTDPARQ